MSPEASAAVAAVAHSLRQQMQMAAAAQHHPDAANLVAGFNLPGHCSNLTIHPSNGGSSSGIPMPKLGSPATSGQLNNNGGNSGIQMPRLGSPAMTGLPTNSLHGMHGLQNMMGLSGHMASMASGGGPSPNSSNNSSSGGSHHGNHGNQLSINSGNVSISRIGSPGSVHDLRMSSPNDNSMHSPLEMALEPAVNLAVGVSGMAYKPSRGYSSPRPEQLFQEDIADLVGTPRSCPSRLNSFKEPSNIKIEPMTDCRGE